MGALKNYDFKRVTLIIGSFTITGFGEDGGVEVEPNAEGSTFSVGADGDVSVSRTNDKSMTATITVRETGRGYRLLGELMQAQEEEASPEGYTFTLIDEISGERVSDDEAIFLTRPTIGKAREAGDREFTVLLPQGASKDNLTHAPNNL